MSNPELRDIIDPAIRYSPDALPNALRFGPHPNARILVINCSDPLTPTHVNRAIEDNYGLQRYKGIFDIQHVTASFHEPLPMHVDDHTIILTTGSAVDLGKDPELPWTYTFRELFLRRAVNAGSPILAPCFGFAQLARLHTNSMNDAFPKGVRVIGRIPIEIRSPHPLFFGFTQLTGYCHHNGSVPLELIYRNNNSMHVHALTYNDSKPIPAVVTFNQAETIIGTEFHRELLEDQLAILYKKKVTRIVDALVKRAIGDEALYDPGIIAQAFRLLEADGVIENASYFIEKRGGRDWLKQGNIIEWLRQMMNEYRVDKIQKLEDAFATLGLDGFEDSIYSRGYVDHTGLVGETPYDPNASRLFFDNFLRFSLGAMHDSRPVLGFGEIINVNEQGGKLFSPIVVKNDSGRETATLLFPEVVKSASALQEILEKMNSEEWQQIIDTHSLLKWKIYVDCGDDTPDGPPNDPSLKDFYRQELHSLLSKAVEHMNLVTIRDESGNLRAISILVHMDRIERPHAGTRETWIDAHSVQINLIHPDCTTEREHIEKRLADISRELFVRHDDAFILTSVPASNWRVLQMYLDNGYRIQNSFSQYSFHFFQDGYIPLVYQPGNDTDKNTLSQAFFEGLQRTGGMKIWHENDQSFAMFQLVRNTQLLQYLARRKHRYQVSCTILPLEPGSTLTDHEKEYYVVFGDPDRYTSHPDNEHAPIDALPVMIDA